MYNLCGLTRICASCGAVPKHGYKFTRHCPDSQAISTHLSMAIGMDITISHEDRLCLSCYRTNLSILKSQTNSHALGTYEEMTKQDMDKWHDMLHSSACNSTTQAILKTVMSVANSLLENILPKVCEMFLVFYGITDFETGGITTVDLCPYMLYKCVIKKYGVLQY